MALNSRNVYYLKTPFARLFGGLTRVLIDQLEIQKIMVAKQNGQFYVEIMSSVNTILQYTDTLKSEPQIRN